MLREYTDAELRAMDPLKVGPDHFQNPFKQYMGDPVGAALARRWSDLHWNTGEEYTPGKDPVEDMLIELSWQQGLGRDWHKARNEETGVFAVTPRASEDHGAWEQRCQETHERQRTILPAAKPFENHLKRNPGDQERQRPHIVRGD